MKTTAGLGIALCATCFCAIAADPPIHRTETVTVTATRFEQRPEDFPIGVTVIERGDIDRSTATTLLELLSYQAGVQTRDSTGGPDRQIDLRGFGQTGDLNTVILVDGQRINEFDTSPARWSSIPLGSVERVEILRGSGAVVYGSGATGGVINIITRRPDAGERSMQAEGTFGSYGATEFLAGASLASESVGLRISASDSRSDNYRDNNQLDQRNLLLDVRTFGRGGHVYAKLAYDEQDLRNPGQLTLSQFATNRRGTVTPNDYSSREGSRIDLGGVLMAGDTELAANLGYRKQDAGAFFSAFSADVASDTEILTFSPRFRMPHRFAGAEQTLVGGIDIDDGHLDRVVTGTFFAGRAQSDQRKQGIYLQNNAALADNLLLTLGGRFQRAKTTLDDPSTAPAPLEKKQTAEAYEAALRYRVARPLSVYGKAGRSFRFPNVEEINFSGPAILEPQTSHDFEIGGEYARTSGRIRLSLYRYNLDNEIAFNPLLFDNINLAPTRREGVEIESSWRAARAVDFFANFSYIDAKFRSGTYGGVELSGKRVPLVPRFTLAVGAGWQLSEKTRFAATVRSVGAQRLLNDDANALSEQIPAYTTADLKLTHLAAGWRLEAGIKNLFDEAYYTQGGVDFASVIRVFPAPGRNAYVAVRYPIR